MRTQGFLPPQLKGPYGLQQLLAMTADRMRCLWLRAIVAIAPLYGCYTIKDSEDMQKSHHQTSLFHCFSPPCHCLMLYMLFINCSKFTNVFSNRLKLLMEHLMFEFLPFWGFHCIFPPTVLCTAQFGVSAIWKKKMHLIFLLQKGNSC